MRYNLLGVELHRAWSGSGALFAGTQTDVRGFYATVGPNGGNAGTGPLPPGTTFEMELANAAARGTALPLALTNTHAPASNNTLGMAFRAKNNARTLGQYGAVLVQTSDPTAGAELGEMLLQVASGGGAFVNSTSMSLKNGVLVGAPTGGYKGAGTINVAGDIYKNNTAYTNPDYVLEQWATGQISRFRDREGAATYDGLRPLASVRDYVRAHYALPWIAEARQRGGGTLGLFDGGEAVLASLEESYLYIFQLEEQLRDLRQRLERLERR